MFTVGGLEDEGVGGAAPEVVFDFDIEVPDGGVGEFPFGGGAEHVEGVNAEAVGVDDDGVAAMVEEGCEKERAGDEAEDGAEVA